MSVETSTEVAVATDEGRPRLSVRNLCAGYGSATVLWDVNLHVGAGEIVAVLGANGAGKSTLLRALSGAIAVKSGAIALDDRDIVGNSPDNILRLGLAHVLEGRHVFSSLTVDENLDLGAVVRPRGEVSAAREEIYEIFADLRRLKGLRGGALSGGQQQQLAVARALMAKPRVLLLDEPSLGLSPQLVRTLTDLIRTVVERFGTSVVLVEQMIWMATELADRAYIVDHGRVVYEGVLDELEEARLSEAYLGARATTPHEAS
jgi:branched-chain amino acid transport system ATP-binding protein